MAVPTDPLVDLDTLTPLKAYLAMRTDVTVPSDDNLQVLLTAVSAQLQDYLSKNLVSQDYTVTLNGRGSDRIDLPNTPITAVASLSIDGISISAAASPTASGYVFSDNQVLLRGYCFARGVQNVSLSYTGGYATIPADIVQVAREGIVSLIDALDRDPALRSIKAGDTAMDFGADIKALASLCLTPNITAVLNQMRRVAPC